MHAIDRHDQSFLPELELFEGCPGRELRTFSRLCTAIDVCVGRVLCRQGEIGDECFVVVEGRAEIFIDAVRVARVGAGDTIGELALLTDQHSRSATVVAATDMQLLVLNRREFTNLAEGCPTVRRRIVGEATRRLVENAGRR